MAERYGFTSFSQASLLRSMVEDKVHERFNLSHCELFASLYSDPVHPTPLGRLLMADLLFELLVSSLEAEKAGLEPQSLPLLPPLDPSTSQHAKALLCYEPNLHELPPHMRSASDVRPLRVLKAEGFKWIEYEGISTKGTPRRKPGYMANEAGSKLFMLLEIEAFDRRGFEITFTFLSSYERMGMAAIRCITGLISNCNCSGLYNGHITERYSVPKLIVLAGVAHSNSKNCVVEIKVLSRSESTGHKVKLLSLAISGSLNITEGLAAVASREASRAEISDSSREV